MSVCNLKIVKFDVENNLLFVNGVVFGLNGGLLVVKESNKV